MSAHLMVMVASLQRSRPLSFSGWQSCCSRSCCCPASVPRCTRNRYYDGFDGIRWKSSNSVISDNDFQAVRYIEITPLQHYLEGTLAISNVSLTNNNIDDKIVAICMGTNQKHPTPASCKEIVIKTDDLVALAAAAHATGSRSGGAANAVTFGPSGGGLALSNGRVRVVWTVPPPVVDSVTTVKVTSQGQCLSYPVLPKHGDRVSMAACAPSARGRNQVWDVQAESAAAGMTLC